MANVAIVGPGAIGSVAAAALQQTHRHDVILCARRGLGTVRVLDERVGETTALTSRILTSPDEVDATSPWVLLAVKAHQTEGASKYLSKLCARDTTVVVLQNGVEHIERVAPYAGEATIVPGIVWISAELEEPGLVALGGEVPPKIQVPSGAAGEAFAKLMDGGLIEIELVDDFTTAVWRKLTTNAMAGLMALTGRRSGIYRRADVAGLARDLAAECLTVARAEGAALPAEAAEAMLEHFQEMPPDTGTSILFDRLGGRQLEWDARNGVVSRIGRRHAIATPVADVVATLLAVTSDG